MPQADRAFAATARRPAVRVAALLWMWLIAVFAPVGATLHTLSHLDLPAAQAADPGQTEGAGRPIDRHHGAAAHCHACDEWQFLNHLLPSTGFMPATASPAVAPVAPLPAVRLAAETPWILPRAPPPPRLSFIA